MPLIDDEGNLFGVVNVVDALVVCLVLAVVVAGLAVVGGLGGDHRSGDADADRSETRYATIDLGSQPNYVAAAIETGDRANVGVAEHNLTITDVYVSPTSGYRSSSGNDDSHVVVRARVTGESQADGTEGPFRFNGSVLRIDSDVTIDTVNYAVQGTVQRLDDERETVRTARTPVELEVNVSASTADAIESGDEYRFAGHTVATVTDVTATEIGNSSKTAVELEVDLVTFDRAGTQTFGGRAITTGSQIALRTDSYDVSGAVVRRGPSEPIDGAA